MDCSASIMVVDTHCLAQILVMHETRQPLTIPAAIIAYYDSLVELTITCWIQVAISLKAFGHSVSHLITVNPSTRSCLNRISGET